MPPRGRRPGFKIGRTLRDGTRLPYWIARQVVRDPMGYPDKCIPLPPHADDAMLDALCQEHTARLLAWIDRAEQSAEPAGDDARLVASYSGTIGSACAIFRAHTQSPYNEVKANTRRTYGESLKVLEATISARLIRNIAAIDAKGWYKKWRTPVMRKDVDGNETRGPERIDRAHDAVAMLRQVLGFCGALGKRFDDCMGLKERLSELRFEKGAAREQEMTYAMAYAFVRAAEDLATRGVMPAARAFHLAIGVAAQFEMGLRQKDIIGEWIAAVPSTPHAEYDGQGEMWVGPFRWDNIPGWKFRLKTSKTRSPTGYTLSDYPMLFPLLERVPHGERAGAIVKGEHGLPVRERSYRKWFRQVARAAGIPDDVWNMDSRAGAATEAEEAGVPLPMIQDSLTHSDKLTTERYRRRRERANAEIAKARADLRKRAAEESGDADA